jgi:hypothetical protein
VDGRRVHRQLHRPDAAGAHGIEVDEATRGEEVFDYDDLGVGRIVGEIDAPNGLGYVEAYRCEAALPGGVTNATVVSPPPPATTRDRR